MVRPAGLTDNIYGDPRIPVRMTRPFVGGFAYVGHAFPQPGYFYSLAFANNVEKPENGGLGAKATFLLFELYVSVEKSAIVGTIAQVANDEVAGKVRFKIGWRKPDGALVMNDDWQRGRSGKVSISEQATAIVLQAAIDDSDNDGMAEWPVRGFDLGIAEALDRQ
jgi:hypothetical protein